MTRAQVARLKKAMLVAYPVEGTVTHACAKVGIARRTHYDWMERDAEYAKAFSEAEEQAVEGLEREARRRAIEGTDKPVYQGGELVGHIREYSDTLLIFLLKGARPAKYRDRVDVTLDVRREAERIAADLGVPAEQVIAQAEAIAAKAWDGG